MIPSDDVLLPMLDITLPANPFKLKMVRKRLFSTDSDLTAFISKNERTTDDSNDYVPTTPTNNISWIKIDDKKLNPFQTKCEGVKNKVHTISEIPENVLFPNLTEAIDCNKKDMNIPIRKKQKKFNNRSF